MHNTVCETPHRNFCFVRGFVPWIVGMSFGDRSVCLYCMSIDSDKTPLEEVDGLAAYCEFLYGTSHT